MLKITGCVSSQKTHMMYALGDGCPYKVIACSSETKAKQVYEEYRFLGGETYLYPAKDLLFYQADLRNKALVKERMEVLQAVITRPSLTVVTSFDALWTFCFQERCWRTGPYGSERTARWIWQNWRGSLQGSATTGKPRSKARANSPCGAGSWTSIL